MAESNVINTIGRRKTSVARVYLKAGKGQVTINGRELETYFPVNTLQTIVRQPLVATENLEKYDIKVNVFGGGYKGQAEAVRLGIARALTYKGKVKQLSDNTLEYPDAEKYTEMVDAEDNRKPLKKEGWLTRDPRMVERKKYGRRKARRRFQFSKR